MLARRRVPIPAVVARSSRWRLRPPAGRMLRSAILVFAKSPKSTMEEVWVWIDLEMTGLDVKKEQIIEIAAILTNPQGKRIASMPRSIVIHAEDELLDEMDPWCQTTFKKNGLTLKVKNSTTGLEEAETEVLNFVSQNAAQGRAILAGNSVGTDRLFLEHQMPRLFAYISPWIIDVSSIKLVWNTFFRETKVGWNKNSKHLALDDIQDSIKELETYREKLFRPAGAVLQLETVVFPEIVSSLEAAEQHWLGFEPIFCAASWSRTTDHGVRIKLALFDANFRVLEGPEVEIRDEKSRQLASEALVRFLAQRSWPQLPLAGRMMFQLRPLLAEQLPSVYSTLHYRILETTVLQHLLEANHRESVLHLIQSAADNEILRTVYELKLLIHARFVEYDLRIRLEAYSG